MPVHMYNFFHHSYPYTTDDELRLSPRAHAQMLIGEHVKGAKESVRVAIEGCGHGELDGIYEVIRETELSSGKKVDFLLMCGDLQTLRDSDDFDSLAVPKKYKRLGDFHDYYTGKKKAPLLTLFVGGNHEASNYLSELFHGGWVAPNIYFLGKAGCVWIAGLKICGISGIFKGHDFWRGYFEQTPFNGSTVRSVYHVRAYDVFRLSLLRDFASPDIIVSHDWPQGIEHFGDLRTLLARKPYFKQDIQKGELGSPPLMLLLRTLRPRYWFAAHLHVKFAAIVKHDAMPSAEPVKNPDEIEIEDEDNADDTLAEGDAHAIGTAADQPNGTKEAPELPTLHHTNTETNFLALSKCLPNHQFLQILDIPAPNKVDASSMLDIEIDRDWLAVVRATQHLFSSAIKQQPLPDMASPDFDAMVQEVRRERKWIDENLASTSVNDLFGGFSPSSKSGQINVQTSKFREMIQVAYPT